MVTVFTSLYSTALGYGGAFSWATFFPPVSVLSESMVGAITACFSYYLFFYFLDSSCIVILSYLFLTNVLEFIG